MSHDNDTIRRIVGEIDAEIRALEIVARIPNIGPEVGIAIQKLREARWWLRRLYLTAI